ncbi:hypothetical protein [Adhaeribacter radiodurans]|uniref:hypothetical protein n=1 Tax=Adhaeribacter radiodurans TaxID=2745197 RepID=UPI00293C0B0B|nr:hypothetical protein [Adhaeribacter radiodurans]
MVCNRCVMVVDQEMQKLGIAGSKVSLGEVDTIADIPKDKLVQFQMNLDALGVELLDNSKQQLIEKTKNIIITRVHYSEEE